MLHQCTSVLHINPEANCAVARSLAIYQCGPGSICTNSWIGFVREFSIDTIVVSPFSPREKLLRSQVENQQTRQKYFPSIPSQSDNKDYLRIH